LINPDLLDEYIVAGWIRGFDATNKLCLHANTKLAEKRALGLLNTYETNYQPKQSTLAGDEGRILLDRLLANGEIVLNNHKHNLRFYENLNKFSHYDVSLILLENGIIVNKFSSASRVVRQYIIKLNSIEE
jgi:hypothetical protein